MVIRYHEYSPHAPPTSHCEGEDTGKTAVGATSRSFRQQGSQGQFREGRRKSGAIWCDSLGKENKCRVGERSPGHTV